MYSNISQTTGTAEVKTTNEVVYALNSVLKGQPTARATAFKDSSMYKN